MQSTGSITQILEHWESGSPDALNSVVEQVYENLVRQARSMMRRERIGHTLQTRALVNETYIRLLEIRKIDWKDRDHFYAVAASVMRRVLVDHARSKQSQKRGHDVLHVTLDQCQSGETNIVDILALNDALTSLEQRDSIQTKIVELRYFGGLTIVQVAKHLNLSPATVKRKWNLAQAWLYRELAEAP